MNVHALNSLVERINRNLQAGNWQEAITDGRAVGYGQVVTGTKPTVSIVMPENAPLNVKIFFTALGDGLAKSGIRLNPDLTVQRMVYALRNQRWTEFRDCYADLLAWLEHGGEPPIDTIHKTEFFDHVPPDIMTDINDILDAIETYKRMR